jgi:hypothetical protein
MKWNYRPCKVVYKEGVNWEIKEVYYDDEGKVGSWSEDAARPIGDTPEELKADLRRMMDDVTNRDTLTIYVYFCDKCGAKNQDLEGKKHLCSNCE